MTKKSEVSHALYKGCNLLRLHIQCDSLEGFTPSGNLADSSSIFSHVLRTPPKWERLRESHVALKGFRWEGM